MLDATAHSVNPSLQPRLLPTPARTSSRFRSSCWCRIFSSCRRTRRSTSPRTSIAAARAKPGKLSYASAGPGTAQHLAAALFSQQSGLNLLHVPYKGGAPALSDLMGGQVDLMFSNMAASYPLVKGQKLKVLATTGTSALRAARSRPPWQSPGWRATEVYEWKWDFRTRRARRRRSWTGLAPWCGKSSSRQR
ncbi:tripartite tricarboxylate transporter substrate-binding protein [Cupriavidus basilensis]